MRLILALLILASPTWAAFGWKAPIPAPVTIVGTLTNFKLLVHLSGNDFKTVANGGKVESSSGHDVCFYSDSGGGTALTWEKLSYNGTTGDYWGYVQIASYTSSSIPYVFFGDSGITTNQGGAPWASGGWIGVWHLEDNAANTTVVDAVGAFNGIQGGGNTSGFVTAATVLNGATLNSAGAGAYVDFGNSAGMGAANNLSFSVWVQFVSTTGAWTGLLNKRNSGASTANYGVNYHSGDKIQMYFVGGSGLKLCGHTWSGNYTTGVWYHMAGTYTQNGSNTDMVLYKNGAAVATCGSEAGNLITDSENALLGMSYLTGETGNAKFDEYWLTNVALTANWIQARRDNDLTPGSAGTVVSTSGGSVIRSRIIIQ